METTQSVGDPSPRGARVGVVRESAAGERRVALVPKIIPSLVKQGVEVVVESGAGLGALIPDSAYEEAGATIGDPWSADVVVKVAPPSDDEVAKLSEGQTLIGFLAPRNAENQIGALRAAGVQAFAVEAIPRISRAQVMDALSSQANVAGYKAVLLAASESTRFFPMLTTAAGTVKPATVLVLGVGVAGLQALATAKRLGGRTTGYDVRPEVADQVRSVGAQWLDLGIDAAGEGGYARELTEEEKATQQQALEDAIKGFDVVITTALVPGRPAPRLVTAAAVQGMKPGSVIVDLAGETGGNCELTEPGETVVKHEVTIASPLNLPATMPEHASELYSKNIAALLELMLVDGELAPDFSDQVLADSCVTRDATDATEPADASAAAESTAAVDAAEAAEPVESAEAKDATEAKVES
ncbi:Re/Si-specific NAD(P)(+) transhydrogenase subunit alpha [Nocardia sp. NBC_00508]|uniref:Re/Si-specific NAD(P)(+) transhydrogenase subunit alpha n=1 Tax=Nocardia sp. NBC_00508 TaxID=2975992 RepID=UPI002E803AB9|nr:Re/Si-specific NAD(P)(+) transhydrogenase subunit alpha [Nocardia sp. NBC_00508]WUD68419.1 Re/Si-specific NAD(P)(+) transhydrogenase subunit alpha [Nocardia sp. NBC_00508]